MTGGRVGDASRQPGYGRLTLMPVRHASVMQPLPKVEASERIVRLSDERRALGLHAGAAP
jgi:hypothetical protein